MKKTVIIVNGNGGVGKDTLCDFAAEKYKVRNISSITPIKNIAVQNGWDGGKDAKSRKFLADLKQLFVDYNDLPCRYLESQYREFLETDEELLFVHIREGEEIDKFKKCVTEIPCVTLLVRRDSGEKSWGNVSDDNVENYHYDYSYDNNLPLEETGAAFQAFLQELLDEAAEK